MANLIDIEAKIKIPNRIKISNREEILSCVGHLKKASDELKAAFSVLEEDEIPKVDYLRKAQFMPEESEPDHLKEMQFLGEDDPDHEN
ncbi:hypothetical protein [Caproicibacterium sp. BJN0003]|uniref:hypothetical protein n=1 Tax=Caproicibacterium sp. BJN0003 TaxID=2994078 RepID=UPI002253437A|nr:hypothetical protein [Caproicibacterium sp. BJN0003]UZT82113.1 hypothetical protein OP489_11705 [Caproicibacterium sp. BJN0003]